MNNLIEDFRSHSGRIVIFTLMLLCVLTLFFAFSHDNQMRVIMLAVVTTSYIVWGLVHHYIQKDLTLIKALEYITIAVFASVSISAVLGWSLG